MVNSYRQVWKGEALVEFTLDDVAEWAGVGVEEVGEMLIRNYVWKSLREDGFESIEYMYGFAD